MNILLVAKTIMKTFLQALSLIDAGPRRLLSCAMRLTPCGSALPLSNVAFPLSYPGIVFFFGEHWISSLAETPQFPSFSPHFLKI